MSSYRRALGYFREDTGKIILSLLMIAAGVAANVAWPIPLAILIDHVLSANSVQYLPYRIFDHLAPADKVSQVLLLAGIIFALKIVAELLQMFQTILNIRISYNGM